MKTALNGLGTDRLSEILKRFNGDSLKKAIENVPTARDAVAKIAQEFRDAIKGLENGINEWNKWRDDKTSEVREQIDYTIASLRDKIKLANREVQSLDRAIGKADGAIERREEKIKNLRSDVNEWEHSISEWKDRISALKDRLGRFAPSWIKRDINSLKDRVNDYRNKIDAAINKIERYQDEVGDLVRDVRALSKGIRDQQRLVGMFESQVDEMRREAETRIQSVHIQANDAIDVIQHKIGVIEEDLEHVVSALSRAINEFPERTTEISQFDLLQTDASKDMDAWTALWESINS